MREIYVYDSVKDEWQEIGDMTDLEAMSVAEDVEQELNKRLHSIMDPFEAEVTSESKELSHLRFRLLFKNWAGIVPRRIMKGASK